MPAHLADTSKPCTPQTANSVLSGAGKRTMLAELQLFAGDFVPNQLHPQDVFFSCGLVSNQPRVIFLGAYIGLVLLQTAPKTVHSRACALSRASR